MSSYPIETFIANFLIFIAACIIIWYVGKLIIWIIKAPIRAYDRLFMKKFHSTFGTYEDETERKFRK